MAHFPRMHNNARAPRVRVPHNEGLSLLLDGHRVSGSLRTISINGGLASLPAEFSGGSIAEIRLRTGEGHLSGIVEMLPVVTYAGERLQPFRFLALEDADQERLAETVKALTARGYRE